MASWLSSFLNPDQGYRDAAREVNRGWQDASGYMQPFQTAGTGEIPRLQGAAGALMDPATLENQWASGYQESPYAQDAMRRSSESGLDAASSMGLMGSSPALESIQRNASSIMNADRQTYLQNLMQKYLAGVQVSQGLFNTGSNTANTMAQSRLNVGDNLGQLKYGEQSAPGALLGRILGMGVGAGATALSGPIGGALANKYIGSYQPTGGMMYAS